MESRGMYIKKEELICGWLHIKFGDESNTFYACCDECLSDPLPSIVRLYLNLKLGKDYGFVNFGREDADLLAIRSSFIRDEENKGMVLLEFAGKKGFCKNDQIDCEHCPVEDSCDYKLKTVKIARKLSRNACITMFEDFIKSIVEDVRYPKQYPCYDCLDEEAYSHIDDWTDQELQSMGIDDKHEKYYELRCETEIRLINEKVSINHEDEWFLEAFDKMLKEHIVPIKWCLDCEKEELVKRIFEGE